MLDVRSGDKVKSGCQKFLAGLLAIAVVVSLGSVAIVNEKAKADTVIPSNIVNNCEPYYYTNTKLVNQTSMGGSTYTDAIEFYCEGNENNNMNSYVDFNFNATYKTMSFWVGQISGSAYDAILRVEADSKNIKEETITAKAVPVKIDLDITNVHQLKIRMISQAPWTSNKTTYAIGGINLVSNGVVRDVKLDKSELSLSTANPSAYVKSIIVPIDATDQSVIWSSSNPNVATVDTTGLVTGVAGGEATITATTGSGGYTATCLVKVDMPYRVGDVTNLKIKAKKKKSYKLYTLTWKKVSDAVGYEVYYSKKKNGKYIKFDSNTPYNKFKCKGVPKNKKYYFKVRGYRIVNGTTYYGGYSKKVRK